MQAVKAGGDRQELHEKLRVHARAAADRIKDGEENDLLERLGGDPAFATADLTVTADTGRAAQQVDDYLETDIDPVLEERAGLVGGSPEVTV